MTKHDFSDGGFVLHGLLGVIYGARVSAWYGPDGELIDAEWFPRGNPHNPRAVPVSWRIVREALASWGRTMRHGVFANVADNFQRGEG